MKSGVWVLGHDAGYRNLPELNFERAGTLGTGADKCDFCLKRAKR